MVHPFAVPAVDKAPDKGAGGKTGQWVSVQAYQL